MSPVAGRTEPLADDEADLAVAVADRTPVSPLSTLGLALAAVIGVRIAAEGVTPRAVLESAFPLVAATAVVFAGRRLVARDVSGRDRLTVFAYGLGGFLAAAVVTGLHLYVLALRASAVPEPLYLTLLSGTVGVAAGTVAGVYELRQRAAAREARRQRERLESFASIVSHDLRNPLGVARGRLREAVRTGDAGQLRQVDAALERMDELVEETLSVARSGRRVTDPETFALSDLAAEAWATVETDDATLEIGDDRTVAVDPPRARKLLENLFRNAVTHAGADVTVRVGALPDGFYVADDGPGIPPDDRDAVLEQGFSTADDGSGLGLAIVGAIADAHGWTVTVTEGADGGARFEFASE